MTQKEQEFFEKWINEKWFFRFLYLVLGIVVFILKRKLVYPSKAFWLALGSTILDIAVSCGLGLILVFLSFGIIILFANIGAAAYSVLSNQPGKYKFPIKPKDINEEFQNNVVQLAFIIGMVLGLIYLPTTIFFNP